MLSSVILEIRINDNYDDDDDDDDDDDPIS